MPIRRRLVPLLTAGLLTFMGMALPAASASAVTPDDPKTVWIYGDDLDLTTDGCAMSDMNPVLQVKRDGKWMTVAKGKRFMPKTACDGYGKFKYRFKYKFTLEDLGTPVPGEPYSLLEARQYWVGYGKPISRPFVKTVLPSREAHAKWLLDSLTDSLGAQ